MSAGLRRSTRERILGAVLSRMRSPLVFRASRRSAGLGALAASLVLGCQAGPPSVGFAPSLLPNLGLAASVAQPIDRERAWHLEARFTDQFVDDKTLAANGFPEAGNWTQLDVGLLHVAEDSDGRAWHVRFGAVAFEARGEPNIVEESGDYLGGYVGVGRFAWLSRTLAFGPELTLLVATGPDPRVIFPQLTWGIWWSPGR